MTNRMNPIFGRGLSLQLRLFVAVLLSVAGIVADARFHLFSGVRIYMDSIVSPLIYLADSPRQLADGVSEQLQSRSQLLDENHKLEQQLFLLRSDLLRLSQMSQENERLRGLLGSPVGFSPTITVSPSFSSPPAISVIRLSVMPISTLTGRITSPSTT